MVRSVIRRIWLVAALATTAAWAGAQSATDIPLTWRAPAECPSSDVLRNEIDRELHGSRAKRDMYRIDAVARPLGFDVWQAVLSIVGPSGNSTRVIHAANCRALAEATSLIVAMLVDPEVVLRRPAEPEPAGPPPARGAEERTVTAGKPSAWRDTTANGTPNQTRRMQPQALVPEQHKKSLYVGALVGVDGGSLPSTTVSYGIASGYQAGPYRVELGLGSWAARSATYGREPALGVGGSFRLWVGHAKVCRNLLGAARVTLGPCAGVELRDLVGSGNDKVSQRSEAERWFGAALLTGLLAAELTPLMAARLELSASVPVVRPAFEVSGLGEIFRPKLLAVRGALGLEMHFR